METFTLLGTGPAAYERHLVPVLFRPLADKLIAVAAPQPGERVLDVACGTGVVARAAARTGARTVGLDINPAMLAAAAELAPDLEWLPGDAGALPVQDASFDVVFCQQGLQFVPDPATALREMRRVLAPGGRLAVALWRDLSRTPGFAAYVQTLDRHAGAGAGDMLRGPFSLGAADPVRELIDKAGFAAQHLEIHMFPVRFSSVQAFFEEEVAATPLADVIPRLPQEVRRTMVDDLAAALRDYTDDQGVIFPIETHIFTARA